MKEENERKKANKNYLSGGKKIGCKKATDAKDALTCSTFLTL